MSNLTPVCCYCDAPLSCASCGREQPADVAQPAPNGLANLRAIVADQTFQNSGLSVHEINLILANEGGFMPDEAVLWFREHRGKFGASSISSTYQSAPERNPPHNSGERLPSSDAAVPGADTCAHSYPEKK